MPPINRVQVRALQQSGAIDENTANFYLNRLDAGQTVDVSARLIEQANQALVPETLPSPVSQAIGGAFTGEGVRRAIESEPFFGPGFGAIRDLASLFQGQPNPAFQAPTATGAPAETLFGRDAAAEPAGGEAAPEFDLTAAVGGSQEPPTLEEGRFKSGGRTFVRIQTGFDNNGFPTYDTIDVTSDTNRIVESERNRRAQIQEAQASRDFKEQQAQAAREFQAAQSQQDFIRELSLKPGGEFLVNAFLSRQQGATPAFNTGQLNAIPANVFNQMFQLPSGAGGGGIPPSANTTLTSQRTGVPINQLQGRPELLAGAVGGGGIAATGNQPLRITPNVRQLMNLTGLQAAELNVVAPQIFGQDLEDLQKQARRHAPPAVGRPTATFR